MRRFSELAPRLGEAPYDVAIYRRAGEAKFAGKVPYHDFPIEYPPGGLPIFVPPALFSSSRGATRISSPPKWRSFSWRRFCLRPVPPAPSAAPGPSFPAVVFAAGAILLYPVAVTRYDAVVALTLAAAVALASSPAFGRNGAAGTAAYVATHATLGFGAVAKLVPALVTLPLALLAARKA